MVTFNNNKAVTGGAVQCEINSNLIVNENATVVFLANKVTYGGGLHIVASIAIFQGTSSIAFNNNSAKYGGATYISHSKCFNCI